MYIYNVTTNIEETAHDSWLQWMKETHIPQVLSTGKFLSAKFTKVLVEEDMGGYTYSVQYTVQRATATHFLFTYGTLQEREVQLGVFARPLNGFEDELPSYIISDQKIADLYPTLQHTGKAEDSIKGQVYTLSHQELQKADVYEGEAYERIEIQLASGKKAWAYIAKF